MKFWYKFDISKDSAISSESVYLTIQSSQHLYFYLVIIQFYIINKGIKSCTAITDYLQWSNKRKEKKRTTKNMLDFVTSRWPLFLQFFFFYVFETYVATFYHKYCAAVTDLCPLSYNPWLQRKHTSDIVTSQ